MAFKDLTPRERISAVSFAIMRDPEFCVMGGATQVGNVEITECIPTAATNGRDTYFNAAFIMPMTKEQLTYLVAHETLHKMLMHCVDYDSVCKKYPRESNQAMDYVVNLIIEDLDKGRKFVQRPTAIPPLINEKYRGMSFLEVLQDLLQNPPPPNPQGGSSGQPGGAMDQHIPGATEDVDGGEPMTEAEVKELQTQIQDAVAQGQIMREKMAQQRGEGSGGRIDALNQQRTTDWRTPLRKFIQNNTEGDDQSRFSPPNKRFLPLGVIMPSHFSEAIGEIIIACDTSGSLTSVYSVLMGELCRICQQVQPAKVTVLWWDTKVAASQTFTAKDYAQMGKLLKPAGGGGTTMSCVADWLQDKKLKPKATLFITDGYVEASPRLPPGPLLFGVIDNHSWRPPKGPAVHINSARL